MSKIIGTNEIISQQTREMLFGKENVCKLLAAVFTAEIKDDQKLYDKAIRELDDFNKKKNAEILLKELK